MNAQIKILFTSLTLTALTAAAHGADLPRVTFGQSDGFNSVPATAPVVSANPSLNQMGRSTSIPGAAGQYLWTGTVTTSTADYQSIGARQAAAQAEEVPQGRVNIGLPGATTSTTIETAPTQLANTPDALNSQVNGEIAATDTTMTALSARSKNLDDAQQARFKAAADDVAARRAALRDSLRNARAADSSTWSNARADVSDKYNAYMDSLHRAEAVISESNG